MDCKCGADPKMKTAVVTTVSMWTLTEEQALFLARNAGKLVCFDCGGWVSGDFREFADHITGGSVISRLVTLGVFEQQAWEGN